TKSCIRDHSIAAIADEINCRMTVGLTSFVCLDEIYVGTLRHFPAIHGFRTVPYKTGAHALSNRVVVVIDAVGRHAVNSVQDDPKNGISRTRIRREPDDHKDSHQETAGNRDREQWTLPLSADQQSNAAVPSAATMLWTVELVKRSLLVAVEIRPDVTGIH